MGKNWGRAPDVHNYEEMTYMLLSLLLAAVICLPILFLYIRKNSRTANPLRLGMEESMFSYKPAGPFVPTFPNPAGTASSLSSATAAAVMLDLEV